MDTETTEIIQALRTKIHSTVLQQGWSPLSEFYDPRSDRAKLQRTKLAQSPAAEQGAPKKKPSASKPQVLVTKPANELTGSEKVMLAKVRAANTPADDEAKAQRRASLSARLKAIHGALKSSLDDLDIPALVEEMEDLLLDQELTLEERLNLRASLKGVCEETLAVYELDEDLAQKFTAIVFGEVRGIDESAGTAASGGAQPPPPTNLRTSVKGLRQTLKTVAPVDKKAINTVQSVMDRPADASRKGLLKKINKVVAQTAK